MKNMKKTELIIATFAFAVNHRQTNDPDLQLARQGKYQKAFVGFKKRCNKNDAYACGMVVYFYNKGFGVKKDMKKAFEYYKKGCNLNYIDSCTILGYYEYKNEKKEKAKKLLKKACNLGNKNTFNYLNKVK